MKQVVLPIALLVASLVAIMAVAPSSSSRFLAAFYPPWWSGTRALIAASQAGPIVASGRLAFIVVIAADSPDAARRLWRSGAWFTINPQRFGMCGAPSSQRPL